MISSSMRRRGSAASGYFGTSKVVGKTDGRLLFFPFEGAETLGPLSSKAAAVVAAQERGKQVVENDLAFIARLPGAAMRSASPN
jgi:hypothetical protein